MEKWYRNIRFKDTQKKEALVITGCLKHGWLLISLSRNLWYTLSAMLRRICSLLSSPISRVLCFGLNIIKFEKLSPVKIFLIDIYSKKSEVACGVV